MFSKFFRAKEVRDVEHALEWLKATPLAETLCFEEISGRVRKIVIANPKLVRDQIIIEDRKPLHVALHLIANMCGTDLATGNEHVYRGVLGTMGTEKRKLFLQAMSLMEELGFIEKDDANYGRELVTQQIQDAG